MAAPVHTAEKAINLAIATVMSPLVIPTLIACGVALVIWIVLYAYYNVVLELWKE